MKKLLSLLGAATLVVSSPLSVIACNKSKRPSKNDEDIIDYAELKNQMIEEITGIYQDNLTVDFKDYIITSENDALNQWNFISFANLKGQDNNEDLNNPNSKFYKDIMADITSTINFTKLNEEVAQRIVNNVNYRPIIKGIGNPLKSYQLENVRIKTQGGAVALSFDYQATVSYLNGPKEEIENTKISSFHTINIVEVVDVAKKLEEINQIINTELSKKSNDFKFDSNSGDLNKNADQIVSDKKIYDQVKDILSGLDPQIDNSNYKVVITNQSKLSINKNLTKTGSIDNPEIKYGLEPMSGWDQWEGDYDYPEIWEKNIAPVIKSEEGAVDKLVSELTKPDSSLINHRLPDKIKAKIKANSSLKVSEAINHFNLAENIANSDFKKNVESNKYEFKIDEEKDAKAIAAFGAKFSGTQIEYTDKDNEVTTVEIADQFIPIKQFTTENNTSDLYEEFLRAAIELQVSYLINVPTRGAKVTATNESDIQIEQDYKKANPKWYHYYYIDAFDGAKAALDAELDNRQDYIWNFSTIEESLTKKEAELSEKAKSFNMSSNFVHGESEAYKGGFLTSTVYIDREYSRADDTDYFEWVSFYPITPFSSEVIDVLLDFRTYFFSTGARFGSKQTYFTLGKRGDFLSTGGESWSSSERLRINYNPVESPAYEIIK